MHYVCMYKYIYIYAFIFKDANPKPISFLWKHLPFKASLGPAQLPFWLSSSKPRKAWSTMRRVSNWLHLKPGAHGWIHWDSRRNLKQHSYSILKMTGKIQPNYYHLSTYHSTIYIYICYVYIYICIVYHNISVIYIYIYLLLYVYLSCVP